MHATSVKVNSTESKMTPVWSRSQTVQKLLYFQMLYYKNSRWRLAAKMSEFFDVTWQIDFYCQEIYLCQGMFVAFVVSLHYISLHTYRHRDIRRHHNADSFIMNLRKNHHCNAHERMHQSTMQGSV
jgi:hypothetical protein